MISFIIVELLTVKVIQQNMLSSKYTMSVNDITEALNEGSMAAFIMFDLSVIDHPILLKRSEFSFGSSHTSPTELNVIPSRIKHHKMYISILVYHRDPVCDQRITVYILNQLVK